MSTPKNSLKNLREKLVAIDSKILDLVAERADVASEIGLVKAELNLPVEDPMQEQEVLARNLAHGETKGLDRELIQSLTALLVKHAVRRQKNS